MKKLLAVGTLLLSFGVLMAQVEKVKIDQVNQLAVDSDAELTIINFWATWCGPCIKEMPHFDAISKENDHIQVYFVSVDFANQYDKVNSFVNKRNLHAEVLFLDESDPDYYMRKISDEWSGAIPATLFITDLGKKYFYESAFSKYELENTIDQIIN